MSKVQQLLTVDSVHANNALEKTQPAVKGCGCVWRSPGGLRFSTPRYSTRSVAMKTEYCHLYCDESIKDSAWCSECEVLIRDIDKWIQRSNGLNDAIFQKCNEIRSIMKFGCGLDYCSSTLGGKTRWESVEYANERTRRTREKHGYDEMQDKAERELAHLMKVRGYALAGLEAARTEYYNKKMVQTLPARNGREAGTKC